MNQFLWSKIRYCDKFYLIFRYSGDWSRIGVISRGTEDLLKTAAFFVVPLCIFVIFFLFKSDGYEEWINDYGKCINIARLFNNYFEFKDWLLIQTETSNLDLFIPLYFYLNLNGKLWIMNMGPNSNMLLHKFCNIFWNITSMKILPTL